MIKDEMKTRVSKIYEKVDDVRLELIDEKHAILHLLNKIIELETEVNSLEIDLEYEDEDE